MKERLRHLGSALINGGIIFFMALICHLIFPKATWIENITMGLVGYVANIGGIWGDKE